MSKLPKNDIVSSVLHIKRFVTSVNPTTGDANRDHFKGVSDELFHSKTVFPFVVHKCLG